eukprot:TRINITY_DN24221_c0_g1_i1.p1 TRINITY_DN24221_c0_g1~~TRINITY_DN24221_c0_g1_i1.p1  ORF type:complete len:435 (-),score=80.86 TRINITY_DN24221_c0_g1_i1:9-1313(-)
MAAEAKDTKVQQVKQELKDEVFQKYGLQVLLAVVAHTMTLQTEAILIRNACKNDLAKAARISSLSNAAASLMGLLVNQIGGKLSDSIGRKQFFLVGPLAQFLTGIACFTKPDSIAVLGTFKAFKMMSTTFSGTVMGSTAMRDVFEGKELAVKTAKAGSLIGLAIMIGPLIEGFLLKLAKPGNERITYMGLSTLGLIAALNAMPETLPDKSRKPFDLMSTLQSANPFAFIKLYTHGSPAVKKLVTIISLQTMSDGKNLSDTVQIWTREHLKMQMESIRNFVMGYGFASMMAGAKLVPWLLKKTSVWGFTSLTNLTNFLGFAVRGLAENIYLFFGALPLMLPGVNASSTTALTPVLNSHMSACGFGVGESTAWVNNLRVLVGAAASIIYGYFYAWCRKKGINAGLTFALAGTLGAALPQAIMMLTVRKEELETDNK